MLEVYSNATLTVAATASRNSGGGLFYVRSPLMLSPCQVAIEREGLTHEPLMAYLTQEHRLFRPKNADFAPLVTRGWTTQERLLSRRILHCA
jgi:hypothetical protein